HRAQNIAKWECHIHSVPFERLSVINASSVPAKQMHLTDARFCDGCNSSSPRMRVDLSNLHAKNKTGTSGFERRLRQASHQPGSAVSDGVTCDSSWFQRYASRRRCCFL